jgi:iron complex outermembrane receptor protein
MAVDSATVEESRKMQLHSPSGRYSPVLAGAQAAIVFSDPTIGVIRGVASHTSVKPTLTTGRFGSTQEIPSAIAAVGHNRPMAATALALLFAVVSGPARAQHTADNAVTSAEDAFGLTKGTESVGLYNDSWIRGFDPQQAGNARLNGLYFDQKANVGKRILDGYIIRVGVSAQGYSFPAPTGVVDYQLRDPGQQSGATVIIGAGPFESRAVAFDAQLPVPGISLRVPIGASYDVDAPLPGGATHSFEFGFSPRWSPGNGISVRAFYDVRLVRDDRAQPLIYVSGPFAPPEISARAFGQDWAKGETLGVNSGLMTTVNLQNGWQAAIGLFRSDFLDRRNSFADLYSNTSRAGVGDHLLIGNPLGRVASTSGEARVTRRIGAGIVAHELSLSVRGRHAFEYYGGSDTVDVGRATIGRANPVQEPAFRYGPHSRDLTQLIAAGVAYKGNWIGHGELTLGVQKLDYRKIVATPSAPEFKRTDRPWRLYSALALPLATRCLFYAGYTQGLEDSGTAPADATNRGEILPSLRTWQRDAGIRYALTSRTTLIGGVFDVRKPYFNLTPGNVYTILGNQRRRGIELSAVGEIFEGLNIVAGGILLHPEVRSSLPSVGTRAVGQTTRLLQVSADYQWPWWHALSLETTWTNYGPRAAALDNSFTLPGRSTWDLGTRYRLSIGRVPVTLRFVTQNATRSFGWNLTDDGGFSPYPGRSYFAYLTADLQ